MTESVDPPGAWRARILIVDDEPLNVDYLEQELDSHGFGTQTAVNGLEALERVAADPPDLVLMDVMMPEMDGITALRILKGDPETKWIPVVVMTALNSVEDRVRGIEAGADDFLSKPVDERELLARIRTALNVKRAIDETMGQLHSSTTHLERYGRQERDVAVLAVAWQLTDPSLPEAAISFVGRGPRDASAARIRALGGTPTENPGDVLVAVFEGADAASRSTAAVSAALAIIEESPTGAPPGAAAPLTTRVAITEGRAHIGSTRITRAGTPRWVYAAEGEPVTQAIAIVREGSADLRVTGDVASTVNATFTLEPLGDETFKVVAAQAGPGDAAPAGLDSSRQIRSILVTRIVGTTKAAERLGDRAWGELVLAHERAVREQLVLFGGEEIDAPGDGFLLSFDSPARAVRCALRIRRSRSHARAGDPGRHPHRRGRAPWGPPARYCCARRRPHCRPRRRRGGPRQRDHPRARGRRGARLRRSWRPRAAGSGRTPTAVRS